MTEISCCWKDIDERLISGISLSNVRQQSLLKLLTALITLNIIYITLRIHSLRLITQVLILTKIRLRT